MSDLITTNDLLTHYLACWNATDAAERTALLHRTFTADATYVDPMAEARSRDEIGATIGAVQAQFPGLVFTPAGPVDSHHSQARFTWGLGPAGEEPIVVGFDVVVTAQDGRISSVLGFLDKVPA